MNKIIRRMSIVGALAAGLTGAYFAGYASIGSTDAVADPPATPVTVEAVHEESGELAEVTVTNGEGEQVEAVVQEKWRGNDDAEDGLYNEDPAPEVPQEGEQEAVEAEVQPDASESVGDEQEAPESVENEDTITEDGSEDDEYAWLEPWYTTDGSGAVVLIVYSDDDEHAVEDVFVIVGGEQIPVDHLDER